VAAALVANQHWLRELVLLVHMGFNQTETDRERERERERGLRVLSLLARGSVLVAGGGNEMYVCDT
jgi:hypothetical protein